MPTPKLPTLADAGDLRGRFVLVRCPFNVPIIDGEVKNQFRILRSLATINFLTRAGAKVILISHLANSKETEKQETLEPVFKILQQHIPDIVFSPEVVTPTTTALRDALEDGQVLLIENLRQDPREKKNDADFARALADLAEIYVNNDFTVAHREHASVVGVPQFLPSYAGLNFAHEYEELNKAMKPKRPALFLLGGAKFDTKLPLVTKYLDIYDQVFIGGALANDLLKAKGYTVGQSLTSGLPDETFATIVDHPKLLLPTDITVDGPQGVRVTGIDDCQPEEKILDAGPATVAMLKEHIDDAATILWNGPFGNYEGGFAQQSIATAKLIAAHPCYSLVGGGDTIASIESLNNQEQFSFLSTAGGAMLTFLELGTLPAIEALMASHG